MYDGPSNPMSALRIMPSTAEQVGRFAKGIIESVQNGDSNPLEVLVLLRALEAVSETVRDSIRQNVLNAANRYSERSIELFGARIEKAEVGVSYDYTTSSDPVWERFKVEEQTAAARRKERETFLRSLKEPLTVVDETTGEVSQIRPPIKRSSAGVKVFLI